jgi:hypothetical protein
VLVLVEISRMGTHHLFSDRLQQIFC